MSPSIQPPVRLSHAVLRVPDDFSKIQPSSHHSRAELLQCFSLACPNPIFPATPPGRLLQTPLPRSITLAPSAFTGNSSTDPLLTCTSAPCPLLSPRAPAATGSSHLVFHAQTPTGKTGQKGFNFFFRVVVLRTGKTELVKRSLESN